MIAQRARAQCACVREREEGEGRGKPADRLALQEQQADLAGGNKDPRGAGLCACGGAEGGGSKAPDRAVVRLSVIGGVHSFVVCS